MDKTKAWLDSMKSDDVFGQVFEHLVYSIKKFTIDKKDEGFLSSFLT